MTILCLITSKLPNANIQLSATEVAQVADCTSGYIAVHAIDYVSLSTLGTLFETYFSFDVFVFDVITGGLLLVFTSGHIIGRIIGGMRKSF